MADKLVFQGHTFDDETTLVKAKKEAEAIEYMRSKTDFSNMNVLFQLYNRILDRDMMETIIGIEFLREIRKALLGSGMFTEQQIRPVPMTREGRKVKKRQEIQKRSREMTKLEACQRQNTVLRCVSTFFAILVIGMFIIVLTGKRSPLAIRYEEEILNKYAAWAQELQEREALLGEYIRQLEEAGYDVPEWLEGQETSQQNAEE